MTAKLKYDLMLLMITAFWGVSYVFTKVALGDLQELNLIAIRFIFAFVLTIIIFYKKITEIDGKTVQYACILAVILFGVYITMTYGIKYTTASNGGFFASLTVIFVPILSVVFFKQKLELRYIICSIIAVLGVFLFSFNEKINLNLGDMLVIVSAALYALHLQVTGLYTKNVDSVTLGVLQIGFLGLFATLSSLVIETPKLPSNSVLLEVLILSIFCTAIACIVQTTAQQYTTPIHASLIFSLEPLFALGFAFVYYGEVLTTKGYIGVMVLFCGTLFAEVDICGFIRKGFHKVWIHFEG